MEVVNAAHDIRRDDMSHEPCICQPSDGWEHIPQDTQLKVIDMILSVKTKCSMCLVAPPMFVVHSSPLYRKAYNLLTTYAYGKKISCVSRLFRDESRRILARSWRHLEPQDRGTTIRHARVYDMCSVYSTFHKTTSFELRACFLYTNDWDCMENDELRKGAIHVLANNATASVKASALVLMRTVCHVLRMRMIGADTGTVRRNTRFFTVEDLIGKRFTDASPEVRIAVNRCLCKCMECDNPAGISGLYTISADLDMADFPENMIFSVTPRMTDLLVASSNQLELIEETKTLLVEIEETRDDTTIQTADRLGKELARVEYALDPLGNGGHVYIPAYIPAVLCYHTDIHFAYTHEMERLRK